MDEWVAAEVMLQALLPEPRCGCGLSTTSTHAVGLLCL